jgi:hypothetical protein
MPTLDQFKILRLSVALEMQQTLFALFASDPAAARQQIVEMASGQGLNLTVDEVRGFLAQMDEDEDFDDIELDAIALTAIAGGRGGRRHHC